MTLYGSEGGANVEFGGTMTDPYRSLSIWTEHDGVPALLQPNVPPDGGHQAAVLDFLEMVAAGDFTSYRGQEALARAVVVDACYASAEKGAEVTL